MLPESDALTVLVLIRMPTRLMNFHAPCDEWSVAVQQDTHYMQDE
jgi:hypothetical protein